MLLLCNNNAQQPSKRASLPLEVALQVAVVLARARDREKPFHFASFHHFFLLNGFISIFNLCAVSWIVCRCFPISLQLDSKQSIIVNLSANINHAAGRWATREASKSTENRPAPAGGSDSRFKIQDSWFMIQYSKLCSYITCFSKNSNSRTMTNPVCCVFMPSHQKQWYRCV